MSEDRQLVIREYLTLGRVRILRELADGKTERQAARALDVTYNTFRSRVEELKDITGCRDVRELGRWWREYRLRWHCWLAEEAGIDNRSAEGVGKGPYQT